MSSNDVQTDASLSDCGVDTGWRYSTCEGKKFRATIVVVRFKALLQLIKVHFV